MTDDMQRARELLGRKLENIISGHRINSDDADWLRALLYRPAVLRAAPEGFVLVPVEPTPEMVEAYHNVEAVTASNDEDADDQWAIESWRAMLAARPQVSGDP